MLPAGTLDKRIDIQAPPATKDAAGQPVGSWTLVATLWARMRDVSGKEFLTADVTQNKVDTKIEIRYRADITAAMRVVHGSRTFKIEAVLDPAGRRESLLLMCSRLS